jgi:hypothetical protein
MKYIVTESQYNRLEQELSPILKIPSLLLFNNDWESLQKYLNKKGNPKYSIGGNLYLDNTPIKSLGNLTSVGFDLNLHSSQIESLGNLTSVGGDLNLGNTPLSIKYSKEDIKNMIEVKGKIYI